MDTQQILTFVLVAIAFGYLLLRAVRKASGKESDCDGCAGACGKPIATSGKRAAPQVTPLVTLGAPPRRKN